MQSLAHRFFRYGTIFYPLSLAPGQSLVLAETTNFNFDTSDIPEFVNNPPVISGSVNSTPFSFTDRGFVLLGHADVATSAETTPYQQLGELSPTGLIGGTIQGIGGAQARCENLNSGQVVSGSITDGTINCVQLGLKSQPGDRLLVQLRGLARSGGQLPPTIAADKKTVSCGDKDWIIETDAKTKGCNVVRGQGPQAGIDQGGSCMDDQGKVNTGVDCALNNGKGGCINTDSTLGGGMCTPK
jgi:hypothetical protein